jgi:hypothetical protein
MEPTPAVEPKVDYQSIRNQIRTGDILLFRGRRRLSKVIERLSRSPYSHVAFLTWWDGRVIAMQSDLRGVEVIPASMLVCQYQGKVEWWRLAEHHRQGFDQRDFLDRALTLVGIRYGYLALIGVAVRMLLGMSVVRKLSRIRPSTLFCSSFVSYCYDNEKIAINAKAGAGGTSPADFALSGVFENPQQLFDGSDHQACDKLLAARIGTHRIGRGQSQGSVWTGKARKHPPSAASKGPVTSPTPPVESPAPASRPPTAPTL